MYTRTGGILQECGILLGGCLTVKNWWVVIAGDDGIGFNDYINLLSKQKLKRSVTFVGMIDLPH